MDTSRGDVQIGLGETVEVRTVEGQRTIGQVEANKLLLLPEEVQVKAKCKWKRLKCLQFLLWF